MHFLSSGGITAPPHCSDQCRTSVDYSGVPFQNQTTYHILHKVTNGPKSQKVVKAKKASFSCYNGKCTGFKGHYDPCYFSVHFHPCEVQIECRHVQHGNLKATDKDNKVVKTE